jgi:hypothetical protein
VTTAGEDGPTLTGVDQVLPLSVVYEIAAAVTDPEPEVDHATEAWVASLGSATALTLKGWFGTRTGKAISAVPSADENEEAVAGPVPLVQVAPAGTREDPPPPAPEEWKKTSLTEPPPPPPPPPK